jgi:hydrogenase/urease accessory protein HupE
MVGEIMATNYGNWAFIVGVVLAIILGLFSTYIPAYIETITFIMVILGLIVGFYNITQKEVINFLIAAIALLAVGAAGLNALPIIGTYVGGILTQIAVFVAPAAIIVALKAVYELAYKKK